MNFFQTWFTEVNHIYLWLTEIEPFLCQHVSKNLSFSRMWRKELNSFSRIWFIEIEPFSWIWLKELNLVFVKNVTHRFELYWTFFSLTQRIELFFYNMTKERSLRKRTIQRMEPFKEIMIQTFELSLFFFEKSMPHRIELSFINVSKNFTFFLRWLEELIFEKISVKW